MRRSKHKTEFLQKASPILREACRDGWFSIKTGLALAQFDRQTQHNIVAGLETGHITRNMLNAVAAFLWRLDQNREVPDLEHILFSNRAMRLGAFQEIFNMKVETCTYCQRTGYCGGMFYGEPLHGGHRMSLPRFGHRKRG